MQGVDFIQDLAVILTVAGVVGWLCQRMGLSVVVGYLAAGIMVGPHTPPFAFVSDVVRIDTAAQVGLVFLMFSIGLQLSIRRLRRMGPGLLLAVFAGAGLLYYLVRGLGAALGLDGTEVLFLAGMLMVSSSAIISKVLHETGSSHERPAQLAMGVTVLEDVVAVVMLTVLNSLINVDGGGSGTAIFETLGLFGAFVVFAGIGGLLLVPWMLRKMSFAADEELQTLGIGALLFALALIAHKAGYSLALGAFLLGTIVAETPHRHQIERTFGGMKDIFSAVFFVAIGMQIDLGLLADSWLLVVGVTAFTLVARTFAVSCGLTLIGTPAKDALRAGVTVTPIGEFSFIIAQMGVLAQVIDPKFYPMAVGLSLLTSLLAPLLTKNSEAIATRLLAGQPRWLLVWLQYYQDWLERMRARQKRNLLWQLSRKRFIQIGVEVLFVTGLLTFAGPLLELVERWLGADWLFPGGPKVLFWLGMCLVVVLPLLAVWRNIGALALLYAQVSTQGHPRASRLAPLVETGIRVVAGAAMFIWLTSFLPSDGQARWFYLGSALLVAAALLLLRRKLVYWHSELEVELQGVLEQGDTRMSVTNAPWLRPHDEWSMSMVDCVLPDLTACQGKSLAELDLRARFGCTVAGIERQGFMISLPGPESVLYARDKVLLLGSPEQLAAGKVFLNQLSSGADSSDFDEVGMEAINVPVWSRAVGATLRELSPTQNHGVQIAGIHRAGLRILSPGAEETVRAGDDLLALGTPAAVRGFKDWLREKPEGEAPLA
ncbi:MAG: cation:proton antiporter [Verrucomicrobiota bacterium]